jgi:tetratricopeptide (TPR) repeat protein
MRGDSLVRPVAKRSGLLLAVLAIAGCAPALRQPPAIYEMAAQRGTRSPEEVADLLARAEGLFLRRDLKAAWQATEIFLDAAAADPARIEGLVGAARAGVWLTEHDPDPASRGRAAMEAVGAAQWCERIAPTSAVCAYWLGAALGVQAREWPSTVVSALSKIRDAFARAARGAPTLEEGGPDRALALFYLRAPGWPSGPGDPELGLEHARKAVVLSPEYPPNLLALAEALRAAGDLAGARRAIETALEMARRGATPRDPDAPEWIREAERLQGELPAE